jgi:hypothetical protein
VTWYFDHGVLRLKIRFAEKDFRRKPFEGEKFWGKINVKFLTNIFDLLNA